MLYGSIPDNYYDLCRATVADFSDISTRDFGDLPPPGRSVRLLSFNLSPLYLLIRNQQLTGFVLLCILTPPYQPLIQFLSVGTDYAVSLTLVYGSPRATLRLALMLHCLSILGLTPFGWLLSYAEV